MSNDLISRSELSKGISNKECKIPQFENERELNAFLLGLNAKQIAVMECLSDMATSYDVDKVVERLEEHFNAANDKSIRLSYHHAIEIVKSGGIEIGDCMGDGIKMNEKEKAFIGYILNKMHWCPFEDESGVDFDKCVGFGENGCGDCIYRNADKLNCK